MNETGYDTDAPIHLPIGYYRWKIQDSDWYEIPDVTEFSFGFQQEVKPQYECRGKQSDAAPVARNVLFGLPSLTFGYSQTMHVKDGAQYTDTRTQMNLQRNLFENRLRFYLYDIEVERFDEIFVLSGVKEVSSTPDLVGSGFKIVKRECAVHGTLEVD